MPKIIIADDANASHAATDTATGLESTLPLTASTKPPEGTLRLYRTAHNLRFCDAGGRNEDEFLDARMSRALASFFVRGMEEFYPPEGIVREPQLRQH
jgi:hypothetical protein